MENLWQKVKEHPWLSGAIVLGVFILVYLLVGGSSSGATASSGGQNNYAAEVAAATQLQQAQLAAQAQGTQVNAALQAQMGQYQAATTIAQLQAQTDQANINAQTQIASQQIAAQQDVANQQTQAQNYQSSIMGQIASNYYATQQNIAAIGNATAQNITNQPYVAQEALQQAAYNQFFTENTYGSTSTILNYLKQSGIPLSEFNQVAQTVSPGFNTNANLTTPGTGVLATAASPLVTPQLINLQNIATYLPSSGTPTGGVQVTN